MSDIPTIVVLVAGFVAIVISTLLAGPKCSNLMGHEWGKWEEWGLIDQQRVCKHCGVSQRRDG